MNERVCDLFLHRLEPPLAPADEGTLRAYAALMDRHDVWLTGHSMLNGWLSVAFADDVRRYRLSLRDMRDVLDRVAHGEAAPWEKLALPEGASGDRGGA